MKTLLAGRVAGLRDGLEHDVERLTVRLQIRRESAFVADAGRMATPSSECARSA